MLGQAPQRTGRGCAARPRRLQRTGQDQDPDLHAQASRNTSDFCRPAISASRWRISCSSTTAISSIGTPNWRFLAGAVEPMRLGHFGQLGWTTWMAPNWTTTEAYRRDARFHPAERMEQQERKCGKPAVREAAMADISLEAVAGKLNRVGYEAFFKALRQAKGAGNRNVELAHWLVHLLQTRAHRHRADRGLFQARSRQAAARTSTLRSQGFARTKPKCRRVSNTVMDLFDRGWHYATLFFGETQITNRASSGRRAAIARP